MALKFCVASKGRGRLTTEVAEQTGRDDKRDTALDVASMDSIIGYRLRRAQNFVFQQFAEQFAAFDLRPSEYATIVLVQDNPGRRQNEIAQSLGIKKANFVALIRGLSERGLISLDRPEHDRRAHALFLTAEGVTMARKIRQVQDEFEAYCVEILGGPEARDQLLTLLDRLGPHGMRKKRPKQ